MEINAPTESEFLEVINLSLVERFRKIDASYSDRFSFMTKR